MMTTIGMMTQAGIVTGNGPTDPAERKLLMGTGWQPYSVITTDAEGHKTYTQYNRLDPVGMIVGLAADFVEVQQHMPADEDALFVSMVAPLVRNLTSKTYLSGLQDLADVLMSGDERKVRRVGANIAGSFVPNFLPLMIENPELREVRSVMDGFLNRIPGQNEKLPFRRDLFGDKIKANSPALNPFRQSEDRGDKVFNELANLGHGFTNVSPNFLGVDLRTVKTANGQDLYDRLQEITATEKFSGLTMKRAVERLVTSPAYKALPLQGDGIEPTGRVEEVSKLMTLYRAAAKRKLLSESKELHQLVIQLRRKTAETRIPASVRQLAE